MGPSGRRIGLGGFKAMSLSNRRFAVLDEQIV